MKYFLAQLNSIVGDIDGNYDRIVEMYRDCAKQLASDEQGIVIFPEMAITGYPAEDLLYKSAFRSAAEEALESLKEISRESHLAMLVGGLRTQPQVRKVTLANDNSSDEALFNSAFLIEGGEIVLTTDKYALPNYGVFDEKRLFIAGEMPQLYNLNGTRIAVMICEETWDPDCRAHVAALMPDVIISTNASPFEMDKAPRRYEMVSALAKEANCPVIYVNNVGGQDELVFDGRCFVCDAAGQVVHRLAHCAEEVSVFAPESTAAIQGDTEYADEECVYKLMLLGLKDYVEKNGFSGVVLGLSGGIDSGLSAAVAVDALGAEKVRGVLMPSPYTSDDSNEDALELAKNLGIQVDTVPISGLMEGFDSALSEVFAGKEADTTEENIQARIRGNILMAISNKFGSMVLTTGNKSELSVGYATLYGDMCGGYSVLKDCYKTQVFALSRWRNLLKESDVGAQDSGDISLLGPTGEVIPPRMISKPPTAELRPDQQDSDSLPPYETLDAVLRLFIEERCSLEEVLEKGYDLEMVKKVLRLMYIAEYKRRQSPPGVRLSGMSFGRDRRYPITNHWIQQRI